MENSSKYSSRSLRGMTMKKKRVFVILLFVILIIFLANSFVYGFGIEDIDGTIPAQSKNMTNGIQNVGQKTVKIISTVGSIVSVVVLVVLGIKYMIGSVEEKAEYKKTLLPYFIGATIVFAASTIAGIIYKVAITI